MAKHSESWNNIKKVLHHQGLLYVPKTIWAKFIGKYYNNSLAGYFNIEKIQELVVPKYYYLTLCYDAKDYVKEYDICLASKTV